MKKGLFSMALLATLAMISCSKEKQENNFQQEVVEESETLRLPESGFEIIEATPLGNVVEDVYTEGVLEYKKDGELLGSFDYSKGDKDKGEWDKDGEKKECDLKKKKGKYIDYKKVVVRPLVKTDDCEFIVTGIIKYYEIKSGKWVATIDFGDGTCDDIAVKTTKEGDYTFSISEWMTK
jgi:hypothetical protein